MSDAEGLNAEQTVQETTTGDAAPEINALLKSVQEMLNEEKWTRAALSNYSTNQFKELDTILKEARSGNVTDDLKKNCDEHLIHAKTSIIALYLSGMIALSRHHIDDSAMISLVTIFIDNHKWGIVKYLCDRVLDYGESKFALHVLYDYLKNENDDDEIWSIAKRLIKVDYEEADIAKALSEHFEKIEKKEAADSKEARKAKEDAIDFYKKALHRYINKQHFANVKEIWEKLLILCPDDIDLFLHVQKKIAKTISEDKAVVLLNDVYKIHKEKDIETAIALLKIILAYDERDVHARREIVECYRKKYAAHSQLEEYIRISNLTQNYRNVHEAINDFEKHIAFDKGNFVFHRTWGVGRIASIKGDEILIDFAKKRSHPMGLQMAVDVLQTLAKNHIWVLKATWKKEKLHEKVKNDPEWALKTIILSFGNSCDFKKIKAELSPAVLTAGEWTAWSTKAREILKSNPGFGVSPDNIDIFTIRERPITMEEKLYNEFKAERNFFDRAATIRAYANVDQGDPEADSEYFTEMLAYLTGFLKNTNQNSENTVISYLLLKELSGTYHQAAEGLSLDFYQIFKSISNVPALYRNLKDTKFKEEFLRQIRLFIPEWAEIYIKLFPYALNSLIISDLEKNGYVEQLTEMTLNCFENYREYREAVVWLFKNAVSAEWFIAANIPFEKQLITLIYILNLSYRDIENRRDTQENRKVNKQIYAILFKEGYLDSYINQADTDSIIRMYAFINDVKDLDPQDKMNLRSKILDKHPDFKFSDEVEKKVSHGLMITAAKYEEMQKQLIHIMEVEVPANSKEIGYALSLGDLRENAEYKFAKEKQEQLNNQVARLKEDLERAQIFDPRSVNTAKVSFGTRVVLRNESANSTEEYTILGQWESNPDNNIISYLSPFGGVLLNKIPGERFDFEINNERISYTVEDISAANI